jgi:hypothetical protein
MALPPPQPGQVIRYAYLWWNEARAGREDGAKDRPCGIVLTRIAKAGNNLTRNDLIGTNIQEKIKDKIEQNERYMSIANILSYVLYILGWCLGLLGRIVGVDGLAPD